MSHKTAIIIGAGPGGLTAAYELLDKTEIVPHIYEMDDIVGGISKTITYKGNRMDIGGHRFFSKSDTVTSWWNKIMPMMDRTRLSRIYYLRKFFDYPVSLSLKTLLNLGPVRVIKIGLSYVKTSIFPKRKENNLEDFFINRFGKELYKTFFKDYTEKVWGVPCDKIDPEWGAQRIKGLSIMKALKHAVFSVFKSRKGGSQKDIETSLIGHFLYPKLGPGQLWETVAKMVKEKGGILSMEQEVTKIFTKGNTVTAVEILDKKDGTVHKHEADYFISTMPVKELVEKLDAEVPDEVKRIAAGLKYRDFITVGVLAKKLKINNETKLISFKNRLLDNWIYIQERDVKIGRLQIFNNWSPYMVKDYEDSMWLGLEYFANEGDELWNMDKKKFFDFAVSELVKIGILDKEDVLDGTVEKIKKAYPSYFGTYNQFNVIREYLDSFTNLFLIGRNGMHRYNNQDHSMMTAITAVTNIASGKETKENIWEVNTEKEYHEKK
jgi:protoporphyrinogen oxidase